MARLLSSCVHGMVLGNVAGTGAFFLHMVRREGFRVGVPGVPPCEVCSFRQGLGRLLEFFRLDSGELLLLKLARAAF